MIRYLTVLVTVFTLFTFLHFPFPQLKDSEQMKSALPVSIAQAVQIGQAQALYTPETVPELKDILQTEDQALRLNTTRKLVERVDVDQALEILEHSTLPHTGEGHLAVHQIGFFAYQKYGLDSILKCKDYFLFACYHGAIIEAASNQGFDAIAKMADKCKESPLRYFQCAHAAGHAILAIWNYDLKSAMTTCDETFEKETAFPDALSSCHNGAFMENLFGVHDWGTGKEVTRDWLSDDLYFPCNAFSEKYQQGCWLNQAARIYQYHQGDLKKTTKSCEDIGNAQYTNWCLDNIARQIHPLTAGDITKVFTLCESMGEKHINMCASVNAGSYYSVGDPKSAIEICKKIPTDGKNECYQNIVGQISADLLPKAKKAELCATLEESYKSDCLTRI